MNETFMKLDINLTTKDIQGLSSADAIKAGRNPALLPGTEWLPDAIIEVEQTGPKSGRIVWEWQRSC